jgi:hypothetical protein
LQDEIRGEGWADNVQILGVNQVGYESGNAAACVGKDLPWLQETAQQLIWSPWEITYRDVIILDGSNRKVSVYNLTDHDLSQPGNYAELKALLQSAAEAP